MGEQDNRWSVRQILVPVVVTLLVGSAAPWWVPLLTGRKKTAPVDVQPDGRSAQHSSRPRPEPGETPPPGAPSGPSVASRDSDFPEGSRPVYSADFSKWPTGDSEHGSVSLDFGNSYALQPSSNTWIGPGRPIDLAPALEGDFVFAVQFRIDRRNPAASLTFALTGGGADAESVDVFFDVWDEGNVTYSLSKGRVKSGGGLSVPHAIPEEAIATREQLPLALKDYDWSHVGKLTLKRDGGRMQFFVNDGFVKEFGVSRFPVQKIHLGAAFESKIVVTSIAARVRE